VALRWYQDEAIESIYDYFSNNSGNPVIAMPTGTGKSHIISGFHQRAFSAYPYQRWLNLVHVKELVAQNAKKLVNSWPTAPIGINSAGLRQRDTQQAIIYAGIGSVYRKPEALGHRDIVLIDECHLVSPKAETMYASTIAALREINPALKVVGLTATPYRLGQGRITDGGLFTDICYDMTTVDGFARLLAERFLAPVYPKKTKTELDVSNVSMRNGDFAKSQLQNAVNVSQTTYNAVLEMCELGYDKQSWLVFASGIEHAENVANVLNQLGVPSAAVHSKTPDRDAVIADFKAGKLRAVVNNNVLTTGFDHPPIDMIGMLRPTMSPGLWVQMLGRGTRPSPETGKQGCLVLDFAGNTRRLGPINDPHIPKKKKGMPGDAPVKICEACGTYNHASVTQCAMCGHEFARYEKLTAKASTEELIRSDAAVIEVLDLDRVTYSKHNKPGSPSSLRVNYFVGISRYSEWVHFERSGLLGKKARDWWRQRHVSEPPTTVDAALQFISELRAPKRIRVWVNKTPYAEVLGYEY